MKLQSEICPREHSWTKKYPSRKCYPVFEGNFQHHKFPIFVKRFVLGDSSTHFIVAGYEENHAWAKRMTWVISVLQKMAFHAHTKPHVLSSVYYIIVLK